MKLPELSRGADLTTALLDLFTALLLVFVCLSLGRQAGERERKRDWLLFLALLSLAHLLGGAVHLFRWSARAFSAWWVPLFAVMCPCPPLLLRRSLRDSALPCTVRGERRLWALGAAVFALSVALSFAGRHTVLVFALYAAALVLPAIFLFARLAVKEKRRGVQLLFLALLPQLPGLYILLSRRGQFTLLLPFDHNASYHLLLLLTLLGVYFAVRQELRDSLGKETGGSL